MTSSIFKMRPDVENLRTGIENKELISKTMAACLANTYLLMIKTQSCHWNAVGPLFHSVHELTQEQYEDMFKAIDDLGERIRALGFPAPSSISEMIDLATVKEETDNPTTEQMLERLAEDHQTVARHFRFSAESAEETRDLVSADMLTERIAFHEKAVWMLRALLAR